jgi:hypothetical protein
MSWWWPWSSHTHDLVLEASTYAPPIRGMVSGSNLCLLAASERERAIHGCTTFVWKCSEPGCEYIKEVVALGRQLDD